MGDEADAIGWLGEGERGPLRGEKRKGECIALYDLGKAQPAGALIQCPVCEELFKKKTKQQVFCSNKGELNCKDSYWNFIHDKQRLPVDDSPTMPSRVL